MIPDDMSLLRGRVERSGLLCIIYAVSCDGKVCESDDALDGDR